MQADRSCERRMSELAGRAAETGAAQATWFLSPAEQAQAHICAKKAGVGFYTFGGVEAAERRVAVFSHEAEDIAWPIACLEVTWAARYGAPGHRDLLGAILALGISREKLGDIFVEEGRALVFALKGMDRFIEMSLERVGSVPVTVKALDEWPGVEAAEGELLRATIPSLRLDAVLSAVWNLSRGRAAEWAASGKVQVDHRIETRPDRQIARGMMISARGLGRAQVAEIGGRTKKGRISVTLLRY